MLFLLTSFHFKKVSKQDIEVNAVISTDGANILRIGVPNPISVAISGVPIEETKVSISKGRIEEGYRKGYYTVSVFEEGETTIYLEGKDRQGNKIKSASKFRVRRFPDPTPRLGNKSGGLIGVGEMRAQRGVIAVLLNFDIDARYNVLGFKIERIREGETSVILENKGAVFSGEAKETIQDTKVGDKYLFFDIQVKGFDASIIHLQDMHFKIKE